MTNLLSEFDHSVPTIDKWLISGTQAIVSTYLQKYKPDPRITNFFYFFSSVLKIIAFGKIKDDQNLYFIINPVVVSQIYLPYLEESKVTKM